MQLKIITALVIAGIVFFSVVCYSRMGRKQNPTNEYLSRVGNGVKANDIRMVIYGWPLEYLQEIEIRVNGLAHSNVRVESPGNQKTTFQTLNTLFCWLVGICTWLSVFKIKKPTFRFQLSSLFWMVMFFGVFFGVSNSNICNANLVFVPAISLGIFCVIQQVLLLAYRFSSVQSLFSKLQNGRIKGVCAKKLGEGGSLEN